MNFLITLNIDSEEFKTESNARIKSLWIAACQLSTTLGENRVLLQEIESEIVNRWINAVSDRPAMPRSCAYRAEQEEKDVYLKRTYDYLANNPISGNANSKEKQK